MVSRTRCLAIETFDRCPLFFHCFNVLGITDIVDPVGRDKQNPLSGRCLRPAFLLHGLFAHKCSVFILSALSVPLQLFLHMCLVIPAVICGVDQHVPDKTNGNHLDSHDYQQYAQLHQGPVSNRLLCAPEINQIKTDHSAKRT